MVLSISEIQEKTLTGNVFKSSSEDFLNRGLGEMEFLCHPYSMDLDDESVNQLMPDSSEIIRPGIYDTRRRYFKSRQSTRKGLMPNSSEIYTDPFPETFIYMEPRPEEGQVGTAGFDLRAGTFVAWSDHIQTWQDQAFVSDIDFSNIILFKLLISLFTINFI